MGVQRTRVGYTGGNTLNPTYRSLGDHTEAIQIQFNPSQVSYKRLLEIFWSLHDPTEPQTAQYRSVIFVHNEKQRKIAQKFIKEKQKKMKRKILTKVEDASQFYNAEGYHQKYRLRQSPQLMQHFQHMSDEELMDSFVAAKLNGYKGLYNTNAKATRKALKEYKSSHPYAVEHLDALLELI